MSTRSTIAIEFADGTVQQVYCHSDGYLEGVGAWLLKDFSDPSSVRDLIDAGNMLSLDEPYTSLGASIEETKAVSFRNFSQYARYATLEQYNYIFRQNGWFVSCYETDGEWLPIEEAQKIC